MCAYWFRLFLEGPNAMWQPDDPGVDPNDRPLKRDLRPPRGTIIFSAAAGILFLFYLLLLGV